MTAQDLPRSFRLSASRQLKPYLQGDLDGLCGVYSLINAIRLVQFATGATRHGEYSALFSFAMHRLAEGGDLRERLSVGVPWVELKRVGRLMVKVAHHSGREPRLFPVKRGSPDRIDILKQHLMAGRPLIASVHRDEHYTVLVGWTPTRALTFDSSAGHWVQLSSVRRALCLAVSAS
ncbi:hypothetical protein [Aurantiacibacter luteus]|uniref:Peptidase C39 domain-containing protein n=1 Tax=Aurantiacibacter luteus TaxID=1581420 RepID=A0A0G9MNW5_9SPHN|nr:hypothetical protein [Aurantiacibacter luteus]KLE32400.1 hypothetical protein AAW00_13255 [Aurantiacibacter luteus]